MDFESAGGGGDARKLGPGCLVIFALPFLATGVFCAAMLASLVWDWSKIRSWEVVPATILHAELITEPSSEGGPTYRVEAEYVYEFGNEEHRGDRVSLSFGSDSFFGDSYHHDLYAELEHCRVNGLPRSCYVNGSAPSESILDPRLRWKPLTMLTVFGLLFGGVGVLMTTGARKKRSSRRALERARTAHPDAPWRWREDWATGMVASRNRSWALLLAVFAVGWNLLSWLCASYVLFGSADERWGAVALIVLPFPLIGIGLGVWAAKAVIRWRKFGRTIFEMIPNPGVLGGPVGGFVHVTQNLETVGDVTATLQCMQITTDSEGSDAEKLLYEDVAIIRADAIGHDASNETRIPILFAAPRDLPSSASPGDSTDRRIEWRLDLTASTPGFSYRDSFAIPVFETDESREDFEIQPDVRSRLEATNQDDSLFRNSAIAVGHSASGGLVLRFRRLRQPGIALIVLFFFIVWTGVVVALFAFVQPDLGVIFALFDLFLLASLIDAVCERRVLRIEADEVGIAGGPLGFGAEQVFGRDQIRDVVLSNATRSGTDHYYALKVKLENGKTITAARRIKGRALAQRIADRIMGEPATSS